MFQKHPWHLMVLPRKVCRTQPSGQQCVALCPSPSAAIRDRALEDLALGAILQHVLIRETQLNRISFRKSTQQSQEATLDISQFGWY